MFKLLKMRNFYLLMLLLLPFGVLGQSNFTDINRVKATLFPTGSLFYSGTSSGLEVPRGSGLTTVFAANLWVAGYDRTSTLHTAAQAYGQTADGGPGFSVGPWATAGAYSGAQINSFFNRTWKFKSSDIDSFRLNVGQPGYRVPTNFGNYPGTGDTTKGVSYRLAPYHDTNQDGKYDTANADFPVMRGTQSVYALSSDTRVVSTSNNIATDFNFHTQLYAYDQPGVDSSLAYTVFVQYRIENRSDKTYDSLYLGHWSDMDLGNYADDFIGSDPARAMFYTYNADNDDEATASGYGTSPPAQAVVFLSHNMSRFVYYNNDTSNNGDPVTPLQRYRYMTGKFKDGNNRPANYAFDGNPVEGTGANEVTLGNTGGDRRGLGIIGPVLLEAGESFCFDVAYVYARGTSNLNSITALKSRVDQIRSFYQNQNAGCENYFTAVSENELQLDAQFYPVPFDSELKIRLEVSNSPTQYALVDLQGRIIQEGVIDAGESEISLSTVTIPSGVYVARLIQGEKIAIRKLLKK
jgi:hypothetical protein